MSAWEVGSDVLAWLIALLSALWWLCQLRRARRELRQAQEELAAARAAYDSLSRMFYPSSQDVAEAYEAGRRRP